MWILKGCPKCNGDLEIDIRDRELICLQCGWTRGVEVVRPGSVLSDKRLIKGNIMRKDYKRRVC